MPVQCVGGGLRTMQFRVVHLDDTVHTFHLSVHAVGQELFASMIDRIRLLESDYFDLEYVNDDGLQCWLDHEKPILRQMSPGKELLFRFLVKFYAPFPNLLEEDFARYLFALQIKRDLVTGTLLCSENTAALLASYIVQAELGDFIEEEYRSIDYLRPLRLLHEPTDERLHRIMDYHKAHIGLSPSQADAALLDTARKAEFYGIRLHFVRNPEGLGLNVAVSHQGILVFQHLLRTNTFSWATVRKLSFKRRHFLMKLQPNRYETIEFIFDSRDECKQFWRNCIEHHSFFRCPTLSSRSPSKSARSRSRSSFRYTGRTEQELSQYVQQHNDNCVSFERPSTARRAYSTIITGSSYSKRRLNSATSLQIRSVSADRTCPPNTTTTHVLTHTSAPLKRAQSEGENTAGKNADEVAAVTTITDGDVNSALPTSGYATMAESAGSGPSTAAAEPETSEEKPAEFDTLRWINETYKRMTGDWNVEKSNMDEATVSSAHCTMPVTESSKASTAFSLGQLNADLEGFLKQTDQTFGDPIADQLTTHLLVFGDLAQTQDELASAERGTAAAVDQHTRSVKSTQNLLSDLTRSVFLSDPNMASWVGWMTSPTREQALDNNFQVSAVCSTQPIMLSQTETKKQPTSSARCGQSSPAIVDWIGAQQHPSGLEPRMYSAKSDRFIQSDDGKQQCNVAVTLSSFNRTYSTMPAPAMQPMYDDFNLPTPKTLFLLPTVTQYGIDLNLTGQETRTHQACEEASATSDLRKEHPPVTSVSLTGHTSQDDDGCVSSFRSDYRRSRASLTNTPCEGNMVSSTATNATLSSAVLRTKESQTYSLAGAYTERPLYGASLLEGNPMGTDLNKEYDSPFSPGRGNQPHHDVVAHASNDGDNRTHSENKRAIAAQSDRPVHRDRWSSSESDSSTGVIHRPDLVQSETTKRASQESERTKIDCLQSDRQVCSSDRTKRPSQPLPTLPLDTLPARSTHRTSGQSSKHGHSLSRSIPYGIHLSGLDIELPYRETKIYAKNMQISGQERCSESSGKRLAELGRMQSQQWHKQKAQNDGMHFTSEKLEDAPCTTLQRPKSVDVKQYQLHLQRQRQQAAALAAAGYPFNPYGDPAVYQFTSRIPAQLAYAPAIPAHRHMGKSSRPVPPDMDRRGHFPSDLYSTNPIQLGGGHVDPYRPYQSRHDQHFAYPVYQISSTRQQVTNPDLEREKRRARRRQLKSHAEVRMPRKEVPGVLAQPPFQPGVLAYDSDVRRYHQHQHQHHHLHCTQKERPMQDLEQNEFVAHRSIAHAKRVLKPKPIYTTSTKSGFVEGLPAESTKNVKQKQPQTHEPDETHEAEMPYPVSELRLTQLRRQVVPRSDKSDSSHPSVRQHHPACASLMGRNRARGPEVARLTEESAALPAVPCRVHRPRATAEQQNKPSVTGRRQATEKRSERLESNRQQSDQVDRTTKDTIEKLRQDLRTAGFQVAPSPRVKELTIASEKRKPPSPNTVSQPAPTIAAQQAMSTVEHLANQTEEKRIAEGTHKKFLKSTESGLRSTPVTKADLSFDAVPENPIYLESDSDSDQLEAKPAPKISTTPCDNLEPLQTSVAPALPSMDVGSSAVSARVLSPTSHSPSLPLSFIPSDGTGEETSLRSQPSIPSSIGSRDAPLPCPQYDWYAPYEDNSPDCYCSSHHHAHRHCTACHSHCRHWHDPCDFCHHHRNMSKHLHKHDRRCRHHHHCDHYFHHHRAHSLRHRPVQTEKGATHRRAISDKRAANHSQSCSDRSSSSTSSESDSSDSKEFSVLDGELTADTLEALQLDDGEQRVKLQILLNKLLAHERKLRDELAKHRKLTSQLKQAKVNADRLLKHDDKKTHKTYDEKVSRRLEGDSHSKDKGHEKRENANANISEEHYRGKSTVEARQGHYRPHCVHRVTASSAQKRIGMTKRVQGRKLTKSTKVGDDKPPADSDSDLVIANQAALTEVEEVPNLSLKPQSATLKKDDQQQSTCEPAPTRLDLSFATYELDVITESVLNEATIESLMSPIVRDVEQCNGHATASRVIAQAEIEWPSSGQSTGLPPTPPPEPPPLFCCDSSPDQAEERLQMDQKSVAKNEHSSVNKMSTDVFSDVDMEYDGTRALNMLSDVIENAILVNYERRDSIDQASTDGHTNSQTTEDSHTSETSVDTVKPAYSPRAGSPSNSTTSASEGSEDIEPFPPPPPSPPAAPPTAVEEHHLGHSGTLTHSGHLLPSALDEVIEEECVARGIDTIRVVADHLTSFLEVVPEESTEVQSGEDEAKYAENEKMCERGESTTSDQIISGVYTVESQSFQNVTKECQVNEKSREMLGAKNAHICASDIKDAFNVRSSNIPEETTDRLPEQGLKEVEVEAGRCDDNHRTLDDKRIGEGQTIPKVEETAVDHQTLNSRDDTIEGCYKIEQESNSPGESNETDVTVETFGEAADTEISEPNCIGNEQEDHSTTESELHTEQLLTDVNGELPSMQSQIIPHNATSLD